jgi:hypothetical protein
MLCRWARRVLGGAPRAQIGIAEIIAPLRGALFACP